MRVLVFGIELFLTKEILLLMMIFPWLSLWVPTVAILRLLVAMMLKWLWLIAMIALAVVLLNAGCLPECCWSPFCAGWMWMLLLL